MSTMDEDAFQTAMQASQTNRKSIKVTFENLNYSVKINSTKEDLAKGMAKTKDL